MRFVHETGFSLSSFAAVRVRARGTLSSRDRMVQTPSSSPARPPSSSVETSRPAARCPPETKCRGNLLRVRHEQRDRTQMRGSLHPIALRKKLPLPLRRSAFLMQESGCVQKFGKIISPKHYGKYAHVGLEPTFELPRRLEKKGSCKVQTYV